MSLSVLFGPAANLLFVEVTMQIEYHKWYSPILGHDMELKVYGYYGKPVLVFPAQSGRFYDFEGFGMIDVLSRFIESGQIKLFTVDSLDDESWTNWNAHPADRARRHQDYDRYIVEEVVPFMRRHSGNTDQRFMTTGVSMGAYHAANFFFRHPDVFDTVIALSGLFRLNHFIGDYMDENVYFNTPLAYLPDLNDPWFIELYRQSQIIVGVGQGAWEEEMLEDAHILKHILEHKGIPHWIDFWGQDVNHDWPWWHKMLPYFLDRLQLPAYSPP